jgi:hypothetical protein
MTALLAGLVGNRAAGIIGGVLAFVVPIPLILILAALAWVHFDKSSAIRKAVDDAVTELVAGAEIAALKAQAAAQREIATRSADAAREARRRLRVEATARTNLSIRLVAIQTENEMLNDDLDDLLSSPVAGDCAVDSVFIGRLRGR